MHGKQILTVLGALGVVFATSAFSFQARTPFVAGNFVESLSVANVTQSVDVSLNGLSKVVHSRRPASEKVEALRQTLSSIESIRKQNPLQPIDKEVYMDFSVESLEHVAKDPHFSVKKCSEYKARVMNDFEPYAEQRPKNPALLRSYAIIEGICS